MRGLAASLSLTAVRRNPLPALVSALGLAAVLVPLLVLYGLKSGVIEGMIAEMRDDPAILNVALLGHRTMTDGDIAEIAALPATGFVIGAPRSVAARVQMTSPELGLSFVDADWLPTDAGDPLLPDPAMVLAENEIVLGAQLAERLQVDVGDAVTASLSRNNYADVADVPLVVRDIVRRERLAGLRALVSDDLMTSISAFSDGYEYPAAGIGGRQLAERVSQYDSVRLYARTLEDVITLDRHMTGLGFRTESRAASIAWVQSVDQAMTGVFAIISVTGVAGFGISLWANVASTLRQQRTEMSLLRLLGMAGGQLAMFPLLQVLTVTSAGLAIALAAAFGTAAVINRLFLTEAFAGGVCQIGMLEVGIAAGGSYVLALAIVGIQQLSMRNISPSEILRQNV